LNDLVDKTILGPLLEVWEQATNPGFIRDWMEDLNRYARHDENCKLSTIITMMSAYTSDPLNNNKKGESGIGKSHGTTSVVRYFPKDSYTILGGASKRSFVHEIGTLVDVNGVEIKPEDRPVRPRRKRFAKGKEGVEEYERALEEYQRLQRIYDDRISTAIHSINFTGQTLIFLETPDEDIIRVLLPILSHDTKEYIYKYTDENKKGFITRTVKLVGYPAIILLSAHAKYMYELTTRCITDTPEDSEEKIKDANALAIERDAYPTRFADDRTERQIRQVLKTIIEFVKNANLNVLIPFDGLEALFPSSNVRDMRGFNHLLSIIRSITVLHLFQRPIRKLNDHIYALSTIDDVSLAYELYGRIWETSTTGTDAQLLRFYREVVANKEKWDTAALVEEYNKKYAKRKVGSNTMAYWMRKLTSLGYVTKDRDPKDKRSNIYIPLLTKKEILDKSLFPEFDSDLRLKLKDSFARWLENTRGLIKAKGIEKNDLLNEGGVDLLTEGALYKFSRQESKVEFTPIDAEELKCLVEVENSSRYKLPELKFSSTESLSSPPSSSSEYSDQKSENKAEKEEGLQNPTNSHNSEVCALCNQCIEDEDFTQFGIDLIEDSEIRERWQEQNKVVKLHKICFMELHEQGLTGSEIAERIEQYEKTRGKTYLTTLELFKEAAKKIRKGTEESKTIEVVKIEEKARPTCIYCKRK
jgi:DNA-binding MarR family transcriptional regulator